MSIKSIRQMFSVLVSTAMTGDRKATQATFDLFTSQIAEKNAYLAVVVGSVMALVVGSVFLYIGLFVNATVYNAIPTAGLSAADNTTLAGVKTNVNTGFTLMGIVIIVIGAAGIISVLLGMAGGNRAR